MGNDLRVRERNLRGARARGISRIIIGSNLLNFLVTGTANNSVKIGTFIVIMGKRVESPAMSHMCKVKGVRTVTVLDRSNKRCRRNFVVLIDWTFFATLVWLSEHMFMSTG